MFKEMQRAANKIFVWSNEKLFTVEVMVNYQNDRVYNKSPGNIPERAKTYFKREKPTGIMVLAVVASK